MIAGKEIVVVFQQYHALAGDVYRNAVMTETGQTFHAAGAVFELLDIRQGAIDEFLVELSSPVCFFDFTS